MPFPPNRPMMPNMPQPMPGAPAPPIPAAPPMDAPSPAPMPMPNMAHTLAHGRAIGGAKALHAVGHITAAERDKHVSASMKALGKGKRKPFGSFAPAVMDKGEY